MTNATDAMTSQYMADVVQAAIECLCANGFQSRTHRLTEVRDRLRASPATINHDGIDRKLIDDATPAGSASGEDAKDAARYRFIRREHQSIGRSIHVRYPSNDPFDEDLDAAIDAAMGSANGQG